MVTDNICLEIGVPQQLPVRWQFLVDLKAAVRQELEVAEMKNVERTI